MQQLILELSAPPAPTLDNYFPGRNGAVLAALHEALTGGERFIYIWGAAGSGRSHLLTAFINAVHQAGHPACYLPAERCDCPVELEIAAVDDVERLDIVGQLAVFDLYNRLRHSGGLLLTAGDRPPAVLPLREDLRTRLGAGIVLQVHALSEPEKREALRQHAALRGLQLGDEILDYLLSRHTRDMGTQMAVIDALDRVSLQAKRAISLPLLREAMKNVGKL
jgi:DnaA family protein